MIRSPLLPLSIVAMCWLQTPLEALALSQVNGGVLLSVPCPGAGTVEFLSNMASPNGYVRLSTGPKYAGGSAWLFGTQSLGPAITEADLATCMGATAGEILNLSQDGANTASWATDGYVGFSFEFQNLRYEYALSGATGTQIIQSVTPVETSSSSATSELNTAPLLNTTQLSNSMATRQIANLVFDRVQDFTSKALMGDLFAQKNRGIFSVREGGGAAGSQSAPKLGVWGNLGYTSLKDESLVNASDGTIWTGAFGADYKVSSDILLGVAGTIENIDLSLNHSLRGDIKQKGLGIVPYMAVKITDIFSASVLVGYSWNNAEVTYDGLNGDTESERLQVGGAFSADTRVKNFTFGGSLGLSYSTLNQEAFMLSGTSTSNGTVTQSRVRPTNSEVGTVRLSMRPGYIIALNRETGAWVEPYGRLEYSYDYALTAISGHPNDRDAYNVGGGFNVYTAEGLSISGEASTELGRKEYTGVSATGTIRLAF